MNAAKVVVTIRIAGISMIQDVQQAMLIMRDNCQSIIVMASCSIGCVANIAYCDFVTVLYLCQ